MFTRRLGVLLFLWASSCVEPAELRLTNPSSDPRPAEIVVLRAGDLGLPPTPAASVQVTAHPPLRWQVDDLDGNGVFAGGDELVLQLDLAPGEARTAEVRRAASPVPRRPSPFALTQNGDALVVSTGPLTARIGSTLGPVTWRGVPVLREYFWYLPGDGAVRNRPAPVRERKVVAVGPVRCRVRLVTGCDVEEQPEAMRFETTFDFFADRGEVAVSTCLTWQGDARPFRPELILVQTPGGTLETDRDQYAIFTAEGEQCHPFRPENRQVFHPQVQPWTCAFDPKKRQASIGLYTADPHFTGTFTALGPSGRTYARFESLMFPSGTRRRLRFRLLFFDGGPEEMAAWVRRWENPTRITVDGQDRTPSGRTAPPVAARLPEAEGETLLLVWRGSGPLTRNWDLEVQVRREGREEGVTLRRHPTAAEVWTGRVARKWLDAEGTLTLRGLTAGEGVYLLPGWAPEQIPDPSRTGLRRQAFACFEALGEWPTTVHLTRFPLAPLRLVAGRPAAFEFFGSPLIAFAPESGFYFADRPAEPAGEGCWRDPAHPDNPLAVQFETPERDRVRVTCTYTVNEPLNAPVPVLLRLFPSARFIALEPLSWRTKWGQKPFQPTPVPEAGEVGEVTVFLAQAPLALARLADGSYLGVLDHDQSPLVVRVAQDEAGRQWLEVGVYLWPRERGRVYTWTFELFAGYESRYNALLRALGPHTRDFREKFAGAMSGRGAATQAVEAFANGVRVVWHHGWFHRNGKYWLENWAFDRDYETVWEHTFSYRQLRANVSALRAAGVETYVYFQFAGVSEDVAEEFEPWIVKDPEGRPIVAGRDGRFRNIWANLDPAGAYGRGLLGQIEGVLRATGADGVALDRSDRLDFTYTWDCLDYGQFNGYASVYPHGGMRRPVASLTVAGREWLTALRALLDRMGKKLICNVPISPRVFRLADAVLVDLPLDPNMLFYLKAASNGKSLFLIETSRPDDAGETEALLAELVQAHPYIPPTYPYRDLTPRGRLLYALSEDGQYPTLWLFTNGTTRMRYAPAAARVRERYAGSAFQPAGGD